MTEKRYSADDPQAREAFLAEHKELRKRGAPVVRAARAAGLSPPLSKDEVRTMKSRAGAMAKGQRGANTREAMTVKLKVKMLLQAQAEYEATRVRTQSNLAEYGYPKERSKKITDAAFAKILGIPASTYSTVKKKGWTSLETATTMAKALRMTKKERSEFIIGRAWPRILKPRKPRRPVF